MLTGFDCRQDPYEAARVIREEDPTRLSSIDRSLRGDVETIVQKALEKWHPGYLDWWNKLIPQNFQESMVYLRTAVSVDPKGWAKFDYVKMPEYRWGVLLAPQVDGRTIPCGEHAGQPAWQEVPGESSAVEILVEVEDRQPTASELREFYRENRDFFTQPGRMRVHQLFFRVPDPAE